MIKQAFIGAGVSGAISIGAYLGDTFGSEKEQEARIECARAFEGEQLETCLENADEIAMPTLKFLQVTGAIGFLAFGLVGLASSEEAKNAIRNIDNSLSQ